MERTLFWSPDAVIPWHQKIFAARGIAADIHNGAGGPEAPKDLLKLVAYPLEIVSLAALQEALKLWAVNPRLSWSALFLALTLCHVDPPPPGAARGPSESVHPQDKIDCALAVAEEQYVGDGEWAELPLPPPAWVKVAKGKSRGDWLDEDSDEGTTDLGETWGSPRIHWHSEYASKILECIPFKEIIDSEARPQLLGFLDGVLAWTVEKLSPPWVEKKLQRRSSGDHYVWNHQLGRLLGRISGHLPHADVKSRYLDPIFALEEEACWRLLSPLVDTYVCAHILDSMVVPDDAIAVLSHCLGRVLADATFNRTSYRAGQLSGFDEPRLVETLMFVGVEHAPLAARFANGDWSGIALIIPIVDRFVRQAGWSASVMAYFLTLCERARAHYPASLFADEILSVLDGESRTTLVGWHGTFLPARIAGLVQHFADRDTPMPIELGQKLLRVLDLLVDLGDRRSAALQLSEAFREIQMG